MPLSFKQANETRNETRLKDANSTNPRIRKDANSTNPIIEPKYVPIPKRPIRIAC